MSEDEVDYLETLVIGGEGLRVAEPEQTSYRFEPVSGRIIRAAVRVHKALGPGFREELYLNAMCIELEKSGLRYGRRVDYPVYYEGQKVGTHELDLLIEDSIIVELKAVSAILEVHKAQLLAYLRAANKRVGLVINFGEMPLGIKRLLNGY